ncbi:protein disulfide oxidoreductase [Thaumasiovibrio subtropicus]|uniref:protein disulfide oxidoreductase n=1 Tax=Thaumasiovibrio subtropicus TaxID=1891207 RepID=UPI000B361F86|nr:protein disulfide oxidoreductase [Thaumasiovibrio subtropicus]
MMKRKWLKEIAVSLVLLVVMTIAIDIWRGRDMPNTLNVNTQIALLNGQQLDIAEMSEDTPVVIYFWATWCGVCKWVSPSVDWLSQSMPVVSVALRSGDDERLQGYIDAHEYQMLTFNDSRGEWSHDWSVKVTPTIAIVYQGEVRHVTTGFTTPMGIVLRRWLSQF